MEQPHMQLRDYLQTFRSILLMLSSGRFSANVDSQLLPICQF